MIDFPGLNQQLLQSSKQLLSEWFPLGVFRGKEFLIGSISGEPGESLSININTGVWKDFASGEGGRDLIRLYAQMHNIPDVQAAEKLSPRLAVRSSPAAYVGFEENFPVQPVPENAPVCPVKLGTTVYTYVDQQDRLLGYVHKIIADGQKCFYPKIYDGEKWITKTWPKDRPLYGLNRLKDKTKPVLIVEGEKTADAAHKLVGNIYTVLSWPGGANAALNKIDFSPVYNCKIVLLPDDDTPGRKAMLAVFNRLRDFCDQIYVSKNKNETGWDLADAHDEGWDTEKTLDFITENIQRLGVVQIEPKSAETPVINSVQDAYNILEAIYTEKLPILNGKNKPISCVENFAFILNKMQINVRYNVIKKRDEILIPNQAYTIDNAKNASIAFLRSACARFGLAKETVSDFLCLQSERNLYNPVIEWIESCPWDGDSRLQEFYNTVKSKNEPLKEIFLRRWMLSAVAAAYEPKGVVARGILVFQGAQNMGKTHWFKKLVPSSLDVVKDGALLRPEDKDSVYQIVSNWLVELGELDATFRRSDVAQLKAFITKQQDELRRPYAPAESNYARRTIFFGSVNPREYLSDPTGSTRYWTVECEDINYSHKIDMQQVFAEFSNFYKAGESWHLTPEEFDLMNESNEDYNILDPVEDRFYSGFDWACPLDQWRWLSCTETAILLGIDRPNRSDLSQIGMLHTKKVGSENKFKRRSNGSRLILVPPKNSDAYRNLQEPKDWWNAN